MDWILVAAMNPHNPFSWFDGHTVDGTVREFTYVIHVGAQVIPGFVPPLVTKIVFKDVAWQILFGIGPTVEYTI